MEVWNSPDLGLWSKFPFIIEHPLLQKLWDQNLRMDSVQLIIHIMIFFAKKVK